MSKIYLSFYAWSRNRSPNDPQILIHFWKKIVTNNHFFLDQVCFCGLDILIHLNNFKKIVLIHCRLHKLCRLHKQPTIFRKRRSSNFGNFLSGSKWFTLDHKKTPDWFFTRSGSNFVIHSLWTIAYGPYAEKSAIRFQKWINFLFDWRGSVGDLKKQNYQWME